MIVTPSLRRLVLPLIAFVLLPAALGAWQQHVHYTMDIRMNVETHSYTGAQRLVYTNNSPDTITEVYYHLFYEAFKPGSMFDVQDRTVNGGGLRIGQLPAGEQGMVRIDTLMQDGQAVEWSADETVLRARLVRPLAPGDSTVLDMRWQTRIPRLTRRGGWLNREGVEYSMAQWYPKMAEYDAAGWHADDYVAREFYGVFGTFDVAITLPAKYVLGGTGRVTNPEEVGCGYELSDRDTVIIPGAAVAGTKTWRFHAEDVHDFAWVADPEYVHQIGHWNGVTIHVLSLRYVNDIWRYVRGWTSSLMAYYSTRFGMYAWPQFTVAMAGDNGMEYPQLIMITGNRTPVSLAGVIAHELGHQWYYGMMANNETQEAWMDEGFTQYLTDEAARNVLMTQGGANPYAGLDRVVYPWVPERWLNTEGASSLAAYGYDEPLSTYHDRFREPVTAGLVYSRGEAVLRMVQYMLGDSLFDVAMRYYYDRWHFRHPSMRDFEHAMEQASGMPMDWFFSEWVASTKLCDYAIDGIDDREPGDSGHITTIRLSNRGEAVMPVDVLLTFDDGSQAIANVPVEDWAKPDVQYHLPRWPWVARSYSASFATPRRVTSATIDTTTLLFDIDRTNNWWSSGFLANVFPHTDAAFYRRWDLRRPLDRYTMRLRPTLWYSKADGVQVGFVADGGYAYDRYNTLAGAAYNVRSKRVDYDLRYASRIDLVGRLGRLSLLATNADGVQRWGASIEKDIRPFVYNTPVRQQLTLRAEREVLVGPNYPNSVAPWTSGGYNTIGLGYEIHGTAGTVSLSGSAGVDASFASTSAFTTMTVGGSAVWRLGRLTLDGDMFIGAAVGDPPAQRLFSAAGATSRDMHLNVVHRFAMNADPGFAARNRLVLPTQGFLMAAAGLAAEERLGRGLADARISFGDLNPFRWLVRLPVLDKFELRAYAAGGWLMRDAVAADRMKHFDAELGLVVAIDPLDAFLPSVLVDALDAPSPVHLSFHLPVVISSHLLPEGERRMRWAIGVSM